jgi:hypothetical protein
VAELYLRTNPKRGTESGRLDLFLDRSQYQVRIASAASARAEPRAYRSLSSVIGRSRTRRPVA